MQTRRMMIEDFELMGHARRAYLGWLDARGGETQLTPEQASDRDVLAADDRLEKPLLMEWELRADFDGAIVRALLFCHDRVEEELAPQRIPAEELPNYIELRKEAMRRVVARLRGEI